MKHLIALTIVLFSFTSHAYYSVMDTADLVEKDLYDAQIEGQFITDGESGLNLLGRFDGRLTEETGYRVEAGFGVVDFNLAGFFKWAPIPDTGKQPALAVSTGFSIARYKFGTETANDLSIRAHPIASKKFDMDFRTLTPYTALPLGLRTVEGDMDLTAQLVIGSKVKPERFENMSFIGELGFDLAEAFTYLSVGFVLSVDPEQGLQFK